MQAYFCTYILKLVFSALYLASYALAFSIVLSSLESPVSDETAQYEQEVIH